MEKYDIIQLILSVLSLLATVSVSVIIYMLERRRIKKADDIAETARLRDLEHQAEIFIIKNGDEIEYLPLCVFASALNSTYKHKRQIYNNFNICSQELKSIILEKRNIYIKELPKINWKEDCNARLIDAIEKYKMGRNVFYDKAKYTEDCLRCYGKENIPKVSSDIFSVQDYIVKSNYIVKRNVYTTSLYQYIARYILYLHDSEHCINSTEISFVPPCDAVYKISVEEERKVYSLWNACLMRYLCANMRMLSIDTSFYKNDYSQAIEIEVGFYEDLYYCALYELYLTFGKSEKEE